MLETRGLTKHFPGITAVDHVDLQISPGEIHALLGENGAGKTTLMSTIFGLYRADEGEIYMGGKLVRFGSPAEAIQNGLYMVHQNFSLIRSFTVGENLLLVPKLSRGLIMKNSLAQEQIERLGEKGIQTELPIPSFVQELPASLQQRVELVKALAMDARVLMLDEPTSVLAPQQRDQLFSALNEMTKKGASILVSTHKLSEALTYSHRISVMRRGRLIATLENKGLTEETLVEHVLGERMATNGERPTVVIGPTVLEVQNLRALGDKGETALRDVSFSARAGEVVGVAGIAGNGQQELEQVLSGRRRSTGGRILLDGWDGTNKSARELMSRGVAVVPDEGPLSAIVPEFTIAENSVLTSYYKKRFVRNWLLKLKEIKKHSESLISSMGITPPNPDHQAGMLSGGNMYKLILSREFATSPKVLVLSNPTRALDVKAVLLVRQRIFQLAQQGTAILLISQDLEEILSLADTILVISGGTILGTFPASGITLRGVGELMIGAKGKVSSSEIQPTA
jgi:general nucleoside transport system ATP-binding protein